MALFATSLLQAAQVSENAARTIAAQFMQTRGLGAIAPSVPMKAPRQGDASPQASAAYYVFNAQQGHGFVIVSGDDRTQLPVLGYSDKGYFDPDNVPVNMQDLLDTYAEEIAMLDQGLITSEPAPIPTKASNVVKPLLKSQWGQDAPFYFQCPKVGNEYCVTGCVATAMAQIMYYHKWPNSTSQTIPAYTSQTNNISLSQLATTTFNWSAMKDYYERTETSTTSTANAAVARLMQYCGQAVQMDYGTNESSGHDGSEVFVDYFRYSTKARELYRCDYAYTQWENYILTELKASRPVMYTGFKHKGGHCFVCDGYDGNGYYHFNFGWYGSKDGYFLLTAVNPKGGGTGSIQGNNGYVMSQRIFTGLEPNTISTSELNSVAECYGVSVENTTYTRASSSDPFVITVTAKYYNHSPVTRTYDLGWGVYESDGYTRKQYYQSLDNNHQFAPEEDVQMTKKLNFGKNFEDGTYYLRPNSRQTGNAKWLPCHFSGRNYIQAIISGNTLTLYTTSTGNVNGVTASINSYSTVRKVSRPLEVSVNVTNGTFNSDIPFYLFANDNLVGANSLQLPNGSSGLVKIGYTPTQSGTNTIKITADESGNNVYCTGSVDVSTNTIPGDLTITYNVPAANADNQVTGKNLAFTTTIKNNLTSTYNDFVIAKLYKQEDTSDSFGYLTEMDKGINLAEWATTTQYFEFKNLEPSRYYAVFYYYNQDNLVETLQTDSYEVGLLRGDANGDGTVDVNDVTTVINYILGKNPSPCYYRNANTNSDGTIDVNDVTALINIILGIS